MNEFEGEIRNTLKGLINNIKEFYTDIDMKLKNVALAVSKINEGNKPVSQQNQIDEFKYNMLFDKVKNL